MIGAVETRNSLFVAMEKMLRACSGGDQFKFDEPESMPESPESLATRDFSARALSSRIQSADWESNSEDAQVDAAESTLKEPLSLTYEEARALLGRLEYQQGNFNAALQVFQGINFKSLSPRMSKAIAERTRQRDSRSKGENMQAGYMSLHSVSLLLEAILLKARSLEALGRVEEAAKECKLILDIVDSALPDGMPDRLRGDCKLQEMFHKALELLPKLWMHAGFIDEAIISYRIALTKAWNLEPQRLATVQKDLAAILLHGGLDATLSPDLKVSYPTAPENNTEEAILLLFILMRKVLRSEIPWDPEIMDHLTFALTVSGDFESLADHMEQVFPGIFTRAERWYLLALCYSASGQNQTAIHLLKKISGCLEPEQKLHTPSFLMGAKLCAQDRNKAHEGIQFAQRVVDSTLNHNKHLLGQAQKFLGLCYGNAARTSLSDTEQNFYQRESLMSLNHAIRLVKDDPDIHCSLGLENATRRNLASAFHNAMLCSEMVAWSSVSGWKLLALIVSAEQRLKDAEAIVNLALDETGRLDQLEFLKLKAILQIAREQRTQAIETCKILLALIHAQKELETQDHQVLSLRRLEVEAWLHLANIYKDIESWPDAELCIGKAKSTEVYSPQSWHATGALFSAQARYKEAFVAFTISLSIDPDYVPSLVSTAEILIKMGGQTLPIARSFLMTALKLEPTDHIAWLNMGLLAKMEGSLQQAADYFQAAHELELSAPAQGFC